MHFIVVQHGLWGGKSSTQYLSNILAERLGEGGHVVNCSSNEKFATYDGIDVCGDRLFQTIINAHEELVAKGKTPTHISLVGYSMGGLICQYAAGRLYTSGYFEGVSALNFVSIATPHLGSWRNPQSILHRMLNGLAPATMSRTGEQLFLQDHSLWGAPLLCVLTHPDLEYMTALRLFKNRVAMANTRFDRLVSFNTAAMQLDNPYEQNLDVPKPFFPYTLVHDGYPSIVQPYRSGDTALHPSKRPIRGRFLLASLFTVTIVLLPLVVLALLVLMLYGLLHGRHYCKVAALRDVSAAGPDRSSSNELVPMAGRSKPRGAFVATPLLDLESGGQQQEIGGPGGEGQMPLTGGASAGVFEGLPRDTFGKQEWLAKQLSSLDVRKVHVDTRDIFHAHAAIIVWNRVFLHCRDGLHYLVDHCMVWD